MALTETTAQVGQFAVSGSQRYTFELIFNPATGTVLGARTIAAEAIPGLHLAAGAVVFSTAYRQARAIARSQVPSLKESGSHGRTKTVLVPPTR